MYTDILAWPLEPRLYYPILQDVLPSYCTDPYTNLYQALRIDLGHRNFEAAVGVHLESRLRILRLVYKFV